MTDLDKLERLQKQTGQPHLPTNLTYELRLAVSGEGPRAYDWDDKPHRLLYDACREIEAAAKREDALIAELKALRERVAVQDQALQDIARETTAVSASLENYAACIHGVNSQAVTAMNELIASTADEYDPQAIAKETPDAG